MNEEKKDAIVVEFTGEEMKNLAIFLNRVNYKGLEEVAAITQITTALNKQSLEKMKEGMKIEDKDKV